MVDLTAVNYRVNTSDLKTAEGALDSFAVKNQQVATSVANSVKQLSPSFDKMATAGKWDSIVAGMSSVNNASLRMIRGMSDAGQQAAKLSRPITDTGRAAGLTAGQMQILSFQLNDVATGLLSGQSPFQIMAQQGGQVYQVLQTGQGGVSGALTFLRDRLLQMITPARLAMAGIAAIGLTGAVSLGSYLQSQRDVTIALAGMGRASGVTRSEINALAKEFSSLGSLSTSETRTFASSMAGTGKIAKESIGPAIEQVKNLAATLGKDASEAAELLTRSLADPVKGAQELGSRLGFLNDRTQSYIGSLVSQNRITEAQNVLIQNVKNNVISASQVTSFWSQAWNAVGNAASNASDATGRVLSQMTGVGQTVEDELEKARAKLQQLQDLASRRSSVVNENLGTNRAISALTQEVQRLEAELKKIEDTSANIKANLDSLKVGAAIQSMVPAVNALKQLQDTAALLRRAQSDTKLQEGLSPESRAALPLAAGRATGAADSYMDPVEKQIRQSELSIRAITAKSPSAQGAIAEQRTALQLAGEQYTESERLRLSRLAASEAEKSASFQMSEAARERILAAREAIAGTVVDIQAIGKTSGEAERLRVEFQLMSQARMEAARNHVAVSDQEIKKLQEIAELAGKVKQNYAEASLQAEITFERAQMGRSDMEQNVQARLRSAGVGSDTAQGQFLANQLRVNEALHQTSQLGQDAFKGFLSDIRQGTSATESLGNALNKIADKLIDMAANQLWTSAFGSAGSSGGGFLSTLSSLFGGGGGAAVPKNAMGFGIGGVHGGGVIGKDPPTFTRDVDPRIFDGARRMHEGGIAGLKDNEEAVILEHGERVLTKAQQSRASGVSVSITNHNDFRGADKGSEARIMAFIKASQAGTVQAAVEAVRTAIGKSPGYART